CTRARRRRRDRWSRSSTSCSTILGDRIAGPAPDELRRGVVRILHAAGKTAGTGFLVRGDLIATCSHVVQGAESQRRGEPRPASVDVEFHDGARRTATVIAESWRPAPREDIAMLRVEGGVPGSAAILPLGESAGCEAHP